MMKKISYLIAVLYVCTGYIAGVAAAHLWNVGEHLLSILLGVSAISNGAMIGGLRALIPRGRKFTITTSRGSSQAVFLDSKEPA